MKFLIIILLLLLIIPNLQDVKIAHLQIRINDMFASLVSKWVKVILKAFVRFELLGWVVTSNILLWSVAYFLARYWVKYL